MKEPGPKDSMFYRTIAEWQSLEDTTPHFISVSLNKVYIMDHILANKYLIKITDTFTLGKTCPIEIIQCLYHVVLIDLSKE